MASVHCKACGKTYSYEKHGCCPSCGAYNRPPRREQVWADGTVHHLTERDRKPLPHGDKVCYERETERHGNAAATAEQWLHKAQDGLTSLRSGKRQSLGGMLIAGLIALGVVLSISMGGNVSYTEHPTTEPAEDLFTDLTEEAEWMGAVVWADLVSAEDNLCHVVLSMDDTLQLHALLDTLGLYPELYIEDRWGGSCSMYPYVLDKQEDESWLLEYPLPDGWGPEYGTSAELWFYDEDGWQVSGCVLW